METLDTLPPDEALDAERALTEKEFAFVEHFARYRNQAQAYAHAYDHRSGNLDTARAGAYQVIKRPHVRAAIDARLAQATERTGADIGWLLQRYLDIATADPRELIGLKIGCCRYCHGDGHGYQWREREFVEALERAEHEAANAPPFAARLVRFPDIGGGFGYNATKPPHPDCPECHGEGIERFVPRDTDQMSEQALLLYGGVKAKRDGYEIIIADQGKALEMVGRIMGAFTDKIDLSAQVKQLVAVADLRDLDPQAAAKAYQDFIASPAIAANRPDPRVTGKRPHGKGLTAPST